MLVLSELQKQGREKDRRTRGGGKGDSRRELNEKREEERIKEINGGKREDKLLKTRSVKGKKVRINGNSVKEGTKLRKEKETEEGNIRKIMIKERKRGREN